MERRELEMIGGLNTELEQDELNGIGDGEDAREPTQGCLPGVIRQHRAMLAGPVKLPRDRERNTR